jgi:hypothetical protein
MVGWSIVEDSECLWANLHPLSPKRETFAVWNGKPETGYVLVVTYLPLLEDDA